jgi:prepilin-type N-terminal cleavage/methylation domain-containing protein
MTKNIFDRGFTLIEIVMVVTVVSVLLTVLIALVNPSARVNSAYNAAQATDSKTIKSAIDQYFIDHFEYESLGISSTPTEICDTGFNTPEEVVANKIDCSNLIDLSKIVPVYVAGIPTNTQTHNSPNREGVNGSGYKISLENNDIMVSPVLAATSSMDLSITRGYEIGNTEIPILALIVLIILIVGFSTYLIIKTYSKYSKPDQ